MSNDRRATGRGLLRAVTVVGVALVAMLVFAGPAFASAWWKTTARVAPANLPTKGPGYITAQAINLGDVAISAKTSPVTITDTLPEGVTVTHLGERRENTVTGEESAELAIWTCSETKPATRVVVKCTYDTAKAPSAEDYVVRPYENLELRMNVETNGTSGSSQNELTVEGGREASPTGEELAGEGAVPAPPPSVRSVGFDDAPTTFGLEDKGYSVNPENDKGTPESQAGAHPFQLTTSVLLNEQLETRTNGLGEIETNPAAPALTRNLHFNLPPGLLGNVTAVAQCSELQFGTINNGGGTNECPASSAIGVVRVTILEPELLAYHTLTAPVFNLTPAKGEPARFGFFVYHLPVLLDTRVRTEGDYGVEVKVTDTTELAQVLGSEVTLWGVPGAAVHDQSRGWACVAGGYWVNRSLTPCTAPSEHSSTAFLTSPTACPNPLTGGPISLTSNVTGESWPLRAPGESGLGHALSLEGGSKEFTFPELPGGITGCNALPFGPTIGASPSAGEANAPIGVSVDVHVPQDSTRDGGQLGESAVKATTVTFPLGVQLSPSAANGLEACSEAQMGYIGRGATSDPYAPGTEEPMKFNTAPVGCPDASKVGTVKVKTPLLSEELAGSVYLAAQEANPFGSLLAVYIVAESENAGLRVKLAGEVKTDPVTGQVTSTFESTPQVPFEDFKVDLNSGPRASLSSPPTCGSYTTEASFTPWSTGLAQASTSPAGEFDLTSGPGGSPCSNPQPFAPGFTAGSTNLQAGAFTPFTVTITRPDTDQALRSVSVSLPPGAAAMLASATQCPEQQANEGTCGPDSLIGHATAVSGLGPNPFTVNGGRVYITGPYNGAPFGLSIVTPAVAGPFNLGEVVVRSGIYVDKTTAAVTINTTLPTFVSSAQHPNTGIPLQLRAINVVVDRPNFEFNPTNCTPMSVTGTLGGVAGATHPVSAPFQVANCSALPFHPTLTASTQGNASKLNGASLTVKVSSSTGQANIAKTKLVLPIQLPSRLTTIQKACRDSVFEANPASCDEGSNIGTATVHTPVLKSPLTGPAYLVSHGNAAFPDVEFVLQGEGITLILDGQTDIKKGITTSTFNAVPDAPVTTFETTLPEGPHSALTSNVAQSKRFSLCGTKLVMPTTITGQNGVVIQQDTKIPVGGCKASRPVSKLQKALNSCRAKFKHGKKKRSACEKQARKKYGSKKKANSKKTKSKKAAKHK
jgi:hypothetical protein